MPISLNERDLSFSKALKDLHSSKKLVYGPPSDDIKRVAKETEVEYIDDGAECAVITLNNGDNKHVVAFRYDEISPQLAKETFYLQRILSTLFPHNFPHFHSSFAGNEEKDILPGTIRTKINTEFGWDDRTGGLIKNRKYDFAKAKSVIDDVLELPISLDYSPMNYNVGPDGGEYFLDTPKIDFKEGWDKTKIIDYMRTHNRQDGVKFTPYDINVVTKSLDRLAVLKSIELP